MSISIVYVCLYAALERKVFNRFPPNLLQTINWAIIRVDAQKDFLNVENQSLFLEKIQILKIKKWL